MGITNRDGSDGIAMAINGQTKSENIATTTAAHTNYKPIRKFR